MSGSDFHETLSIPNLPFSDFRIVDLADRGGYSAVYRAVYTPSGGKPATVALKVLNAHADIIHSNKAVMGELQIQYGLRSTHVVRCHGVTVTKTMTGAFTNGKTTPNVDGSGEDKFVIVMEYL